MEAIRLFGYEAIKLILAHGPWSVNLADFQQHLLFSNGGRRCPLPKTSLAEDVLAEDVFGRRRLLLTGAP